MSTQIIQHAGPIIIIFTTISPTNNTQRVRIEPKVGQGYSQVRLQSSIKVFRHCQLICMPCFTGSSPRQPTIRTNSKIRMVSAEDTTKLRVPQVKWLSAIIHLPSCYVSRHCFVNWFTPMGAKLFILSANWCFHALCAPGSARYCNRSATQPD